MCDQLDVIDEIPNSSVSNWTFEEGDVDDANNRPQREAYISKVAPADSRISTPLEASGNKLRSGEITPSKPMSPNVFVSQRFDQIDIVKRQSNTVYQPDPKRTSTSDFINEEFEVCRSLSDLNKHNSSRIKAMDQLPSISIKSPP